MPSSAAKVFSRPNGALVVRTGHFTGRSPKDKYIVRDRHYSDPPSIGVLLTSLCPRQDFDSIYSRLAGFWKGQDIYVQDCFAGADPEFRLPIRVITQRAWHNMFARQLFIRPDWQMTQDHVPEFTVMFAPTFHANPERTGPTPRPASP